MSTALAAAIAAQPAALERILSHDLSAAVERLAGARRIWLVGTGTSQHAAELGALMFRAGGRDADWLSSAAFVQASATLGPGDAVLIISHTAQTSSARSAREQVTDSEATLVSITGAGRGWSEAIETVAPEASETYTVSYTTTLLVLGRLSLGLGPGAFSQPDLERVPEAVAGVLDAGVDDVPIPDRVLVIAGWGAAAITAREGALKLREAARVLSEGYEAEYLLHGGAVPLTATDGLLLLAPEADPDGLTKRLGQAAAEAGLSVHSLAAPAGLPPLLAQIPLTVRLQMLAESAARSRGQNPDRVIVGPWADAGLWAAGAPPGTEPA